MAVQSEDVGLDAISLKSLMHKKSPLVAKPASKAIFYQDTI